MGDKSPKSKERARKQASARKEAKQAAPRAGQKRPDPVEAGK